MSKKSRKNPSKPATSKVAKRASAPVANKAAKATTKTATKTATKPASKSPAKKAATKPAKKVVKTAEKAVAKPAAKAVVKPAPKAASKTTKAAAPKKTVAAKTSPMAAAKAPAKPATSPVPKPVAAPKPVPEKAKAPAPAIAAEGATAPAFELPRDGGATVSLSDYAGQKLVIFFYPRASTPGCTKEAMDFTRLSGDFQAAGAAVLGVSADSQKAQESFRDKYRLGVPLLSDATQAMLRSYGAWGEKSMYGKIFEGVLRTTVLIATDGTVAKIWRSVKVDGHADAVLEEAIRI